MKASKLTRLETYYLSDHAAMPIWTEVHVAKVAEEVGARESDWLSEKQKSVIEAECRKLDAFCEVLCSTTKNHVAAEKTAFKINDDFYKACDTQKAEWQKEREKALAKRERELAKAQKEEAKRQVAVEKAKVYDMKANLHLEKNLNKAQRDALLSRGYKRIKISPFGNSGAAFYWVQTNWHESKEHAFFVYLIESELKRYVDDVHLDSFGSPDIEFGNKYYKYCFEIETGENLKRNAERMKRRFRELKDEYSEVFVFVTNKKLKYKYSKFGTIVTRGTLRKTIASLFKGYKRRRPPL